MVNIKDFGATGAADQLCTGIIQQAIEEGSARGGETIYFPAGTYLTGTIYLKSNITLYLENGALLLGSSNPADYNADDFCPQNTVFVREKVSGAHLIVAVEVENVAITGHGRIDGNRKAFSDRTWKEHPKVFEFPEWRPGQMLFFCECKNVTIENVQLYHSPYWTCFLHGCEDVCVTGVRIWNDQRTWNGDGIDIDCCTRVTISNCNIDSGDDCITLRGSLKPLKNQSRLCQFVTITNCILRTKANAFRIGVGNGSIRDCLISNCIIRETRTGICIISKYGQQSVGVQIENIQFNNIFFDCQRPLLISSYVRGCHPESAKLIRNISFNHLRGRATQSCFVTGNPDCMIKDIYLSDVCFEYSGGSDIEEHPERSYAEFGSPAAPAAFYLQNAEKLRLYRVRIEWKDTDGPWQAAVIAENVSELELSECHLEPPPNGVSVINK